MTAVSGGRPTGMVVGSFTSVSLDPPLIAFLPGKSSTTWPRILDAGQFCVNVLSSEQEFVCQALMTKSTNKLSALDWYPSALTGSPALPGSVAWIDCQITDVVEAGDHWIAIGEVLDLDIGNALGPLLFFRGGYGRFAAGSRVATGIEFGTQLNALNRVRPAMEQLAVDLGCECVAAAHIDDKIVLIASAGQARGWDLPSRVGERFPALAPFGRSLIAWSDEATIDGWLASVPDAEANRLRRMLGTIRARGYSVTVNPVATGNGNHIPEKRPDLRSVLDPGTELFREDGADPAPLSIAVPVLDDTDHPLFALALYGFADPTGASDLEFLAAELRKAAATTAPANPLVPPPWPAR